MSDDGLFREVEEEVRRDKLTQMWNRFGTLFIAGCVGIVLVVGGFKGWQYWQAQLAEKAGMEWYNAITLSAAGKIAEADAAFDEITKSGHKGYSVLAKLSQAARLGQDGNKVEAVKIYDGVAADAAVDQPLRDLARVRAAYLLVDTDSVSDLSSRLSGLDSENSSWRHAVREILALAHVRASDFKAADEQLKLILADPATPAALRARTVLVAAQIQPQLPANTN
ncbi:MAG: tetratricopeptide repeat protein [Pseudomonadota bacterium]